MFPTAEAAAESLGLKAGTYRAYERASDASKVTRLNDQRAAQFAKKFKVDFLWLLNGEGTPFVREMTKAQERVVAIMADKSEAEQERIATAIEALLRAG
jgi:hypothetical protein